MWPALISGGLGLIGSIMGSDQSAKNTQEQIQASQQMQASQNAFTEQMSNTAYQRSSADMKAAGLNPALMFGSGSAASTPVASNAQAPMPQTRSPWENLGSIAKDSIGAAIQAKTMEKMTDEIANLQATRNEINARTASEEQRPNLIRREAGLVGQKWATEAEQTDIAHSQARKAGMVQELVDNPVTRKIMQGGVLGSSASDVVKPVLDTVGALSNSALKSALIRRYGNASELTNSATSWRRGYDAGLHEGE